MLEFSEKPNYVTKIINNNEMDILVKYWNKKSKRLKFYLTSSSIAMSVSITANSLWSTLGFV